VGWLSEIFYALRARIGEPETNAILGPLHSGQLAYENALQRALKELLDTVVNGHCAADTRISDLLSSFIGDAGREPQAQGVELVADDPDAAEIITRHLGDIRAEGDRYVAGLAAARQKSGQIGGAPHAE
jgi:hypothetical protein